MTGATARRTLAVACALVLAGSLTGPADAAGGQDRRTPVIRVTSAPIAFSPNGDGVKDVAKVRYRLARASRVTAIVSSGDRFVLRRELGQQARGTHVLTWDGTRRGKIERDARYTVTFLTGQGRARAAVEIDNVDDRRPVASIGFSTTKVYPRTTVIRDVAAGGFRPSVDPDDGSETAPGSLDGLRLQAVAASGRVVGSDPVDTRTCDAQEPGRCAVGLTWDGRDDRGRPLPAGSYSLRVVRGTTAGAGTPVVLTNAATVTVSNIRLVARTYYSTVSAADALRGDRSTYTPAPSPCPPVASTRFTGGLSFRPGTAADGRACDGEETFYLNVDPSNRRSPFDTYTVSVTGGPSAAGGTGSGTLSVVDGQPVTVSGDSGTTSNVATGWTTPARHGQRYGDRSPAVWTFRAAPGQSYDIQTIHVAIRQFGAFS